MSTITVTSAADSGAGSLRAAIAAAQPGATIRFASTLANQTITLTSGQLVVGKNLTIDGADATNLTISGNNASRVFLLQREKSLTLQNLTIANGRLNSPRLNFLSDTETERAKYSGAGIHTESQTKLTLVNTRVNNNVAGYGGGIYSGWRSTTRIINSSFNGNDGTAAFKERGGGAIATASGGKLTVIGSRFTNNRGINGGAINSLLGTLTVDNSVFLNNDSTRGGDRKGGTSGYGGAIYTDGANASGSRSGPGTVGGTITIRNSRFEGNRGAGQGGGLFLFAYPPDQVIVEGSTIIGNSVVRDADGSALGGGLRHGNAKLTVRNTTFANNTSVGQGGGIWVGENSPTIISNSTFSGNVADDNKGGGLGGAITLGNRSNPTTITNTTIVNNRAGFQGGAFWFGDQSVTLANSIVSNNTAGNRWGTKIQTGRPLRDGGGNIEFPAPAAGESKVTPRSRIVDPRLGALQENPGYVPTHPLQSGSPALARGSGANILVQGTARRDTLLGSGNSEVLVGKGSADVLTGNGGADRFAYYGTTQTKAFLNSRAGAVDRITDFRVQEGDRLSLDYDDNLATRDRPTGLFNAGAVSGGNIVAAARLAYADKNSRSRGKQSLKGNEAVLFQWKQRTFLSVNDRAVGFSNRDLLVDVTGITRPQQDVTAGVLPVARYFL